MCGRFSLMAVAEVLADRYSMSLGSNIFFEKGTDTSRIMKRYNIAPSQEVPVIVSKPSFQISVFRWGLVPHWTKDSANAYKMINARGESILEKPSYKGPFKSTRCLVPATGFFEWRKSDKTPFHFQLKNEELFSMAGIWDSYKDKEGKEIKTFSIITTSPNPLVKDLHDRMPVILEKDAEKYWLDDNPTEELYKMIKPFPADKMKRYEVSRLINSAKEDKPELVLPVSSQTRLI